MKKVRLDVLVQRETGLSRAKAQALIGAGQVFGGSGERLDKPGHSFPEDTELRIEGGPRYVSRGGQKLEAALDGFDIDVTDRIALDAGASTGGFTDCLLQRGAARVYAVDVGYGQLDWRLRNDARVDVLERTNIRHLAPGALDPRPNFFTVDCSFISLRTVLPAVAGLVTADAVGVVLIKPQFEAGKKQVGKGGVVRDPEVREQVVETIRKAAPAVGFQVAGVIPSPLRGPAGNIEYLAYLVRPPG